MKFGGCAKIRGAKIKGARKFKGIRYGLQNTHSQSSRTQIPPKNTSPHPQTRQNLYLCHMFFHLCSMCNPVLRIHIHRKNQISCRSVHILRCFPYHRGVLKDRNICIIYLSGRKDSINKYSSLFHFFIRIVNEVI